MAGAVGFQPTLLKTFIPSVIYLFRCDLQLATSFICQISPVYQHPITQSHHFQTKYRICKIEYREMVAQKSNRRRDEDSGKSRLMSVIIPVVLNFVRACLAIKLLRRLTKSSLNADTFVSARGGGSKPLPTISRYSKIKYNTS